MKVKKFLAAIMQEELGPIRERRSEFEKDIPAVYEMLKKGCEVARETAAQTMDEVRKAMKINYFDDVELIAEQAKRFAPEDNVFIVPDIFLYMYVCYACCCMIRYVV